jgi:hypothetical protein
VYEGFDATIRERESKGETVENRIVAIKKSDITGAELRKRMAQMTMRFVSQLICVTRDKAGTVTDGDPQKVTDLTDVWTFARNLSSRDPNGDRSRMILDIDPMRPFRRTAETSAGSFFSYRWKGIAESGSSVACGRSAASTDSVEASLVSYRIVIGGPAHGIPPRIRVMGRLFASRALPQWVGTGGSRGDRTSVRRRLRPDRSAAVTSVSQGSRRPGRTGGTRRKLVVIQPSIDTMPRARAARRSN